MIVHRHSQHFSNMKRLPIRVLRDLLVATEIVGEYDRLWATGAHRRQQDALSERLCNSGVCALEAEWTGHTTTAAIEGFQLNSHPS